MISLDYVSEYIKGHYDYDYDFVLLLGFDIQQDYSIDRMYGNSAIRCFNKIFYNSKCEYYDNWELL
jgi:hypothetical protein